MTTGNPPNSVRYRFELGGYRDGHDMAAINYNTLWRLVATIDHYRALTNTQLQREGE